MHTQGFVPTQDQLDPSQRQLGAGLKSLEKLLQDLRGTLMLLGDGVPARRTRMGQDC